MAYLLDANVFIQAHRLHYGFDFCPAFWEWLVAANAKGDVFSIERVGGELTGGDDQLATWAGDRGDGLFLPPDAKVAAALGPVSTWATGKGYDAAAVNTFLQVADYFLVAHALAHGHTVVTHERASDSKKKIKIPDACLGLKVKFVNTFEMLRAQKARFVLAKAGG